MPCAVLDSHHPYGMDPHSSTGPKKNCTFIHKMLKKRSSYSVSVNLEGSGIKSYCMRGKISYYIYIRGRARSRMLLMFSLIFGSCSIHMTLLSPYNVHFTSTSIGKGSQNIQ